MNFRYTRKWIKISRIRIQTLGSKWIQLHHWSCVAAATTDDNITFASAALASFNCVLSDSLSAFNDVKRSFNSLLTDSKSDLHNAHNHSVTHLISTLITQLASCLIYARALLGYVIFIMWVRSVNKMLPSVKVAEDKVLTFLLFSVKNAKIVQLWV